MEQLNVVQNKVLKLCEQISDIALILEVKVVPYTDDAKELFLKMPPAECLRIHEALKQYHALLHKAFHENGVKSSQDLFQFVLREMNLTTDNKFIDSLEPDSVVEIYNLDGMQIFRNFEMFKACTYSLLELVYKQWFELFERDEEVTNEILFRAKEVLTSMEPHCKEWQVKDHVLKEKISQSKSVFVIEMGSLVPVSGEEGDVFGFASSLKAKKYAA